MNLRVKNLEKFTKEVSIMLSLSEHLKNSHNFKLDIDANPIVGRDARTFCLQCMHNVCLLLLYCSDSPLLCLYIRANATTTELSIKKNSTLKLETL